MNENEEEIKKPKKRRSGFGFRIAQAVIFFLLAVSMVAVMFLAGISDVLFVEDFHEYFLNEFSGSWEYEREHVEDTEYECFLKAELVKRDGELRYVGTVYYQFPDGDESVVRYDYSYVETDKWNEYMTFENGKRVSFELLTGELSYEAYINGGTEAEDYYEYLLSCDFNGITLFRDDFEVDCWQYYTLITRDGELALEISRTYSEYGQHREYILSVVPYSATDEVNFKFLFESQDGTVYEISVVHDYLSYESDIEYAITFIVFAVVFFFVSVFTFVLAFIGKKHKWADVTCIVISGLFCLIGIMAPGSNWRTEVILLGIVLILLFVWGVVGGAMGVHYLTPPKEKKKRVKKIKPNKKKTVSEPTIQEQTTLCAETEPLDSVTQSIEALNLPKADMKEPNKKVTWGIFGGVIAYYVLWLVIGILSMAMPQKGIAWGPYENEAYTVAMNFLAGFMMVLLIPSFGYFFVFRGPLRLSKKVCVIIVSSCVAVTVLGDILFYALMGKYLSLVSVTMKIAPIFSEVGLIAVYAAGFLRISPEKLEKSEYEKTGDTWKDFFGSLLCTLKNVLKFLMRNRNKIGFILGGTVAFTLCTFCLLEALYVLIAIMAILLFVLVIQYLYTPSAKYTNEYFVTDSSGSARVLNYETYNGFTGEDLYKDDLGNVWATKDGGKSFCPVTADNNRHPEDSAGGIFIDHEI